MIVVEKLAAEFKIEFMEPGNSFADVLGLQFDILPVVKTLLNHII